MDAVILVRRLNGPVFALNPDLIERAESTPDTVITLGDGTKYVVAESVQELLALVLDFRARVIARARLIEDSIDIDSDAPPPAPRPLRGL
jgi:flagellar protein FlbD